MLNFYDLFLIFSILLSAAICITIIAMIGFELAAKRQKQKQQAESDKPFWDFTDRPCDRYER